ncbi:hypothetical protein GGX14DRAFT_409093 [Mycena pura]|uniref:Uncharacterized protein n=1 Tax=Mycena pura TaxID=153505 RepID=A0AAD6XVC9_9AGAR|nr:hypothetical protein GGX14DRAFT_409093 [Mycena pura]
MPTFCTLIQPYNLSVWWNRPRFAEPAQCPYTTAMSAPTRCAHVLRDVASPTPLRASALLRLHSGRRTRILGNQRCRPWTSTWLSIAWGIGASMELWGGVRLAWLHRVPSFRSPVLPRVRPCSRQHAQAIGALRSPRLTDRVSVHVVSARQRTGALRHLPHSLVDCLAAARLPWLLSAPWLGIRHYCSGTFARHRGARRLGIRAWPWSEERLTRLHLARVVREHYNVKMSLFSFDFDDIAPLNITSAQLRERQLARSLLRMCLPRAASRRSVATQERQRMPQVGGELQQLGGAGKGRDSDASLGGMPAVAQHSIALLATAMSPSAGGRIFYSRRDVAGGLWGCRSSVMAQ